MDLKIPQSLVRWRAAPRLIPSRYPVAGLFDRVATPADLDAIFELEGWTNDRITAELGILSAVPREEWVVGPTASVVMAAFCHPHVGGSRFSSGDRGAWYAAKTIETALAESTFHRTEELREVGGFETRVQMRVYLADFSASFHDVRTLTGARASLRKTIYDPDDYSGAQRFARGLFDQGANGIVYRSVRHQGGECVACFRPALVKNVRAGGHYEFRWQGKAEPIVRKL